MGVMVAPKILKANNNINANRTLSLFEPFIGSAHMDKGYSYE